MNKYEIVRQIGDGTYGIVAKAIHKPTGQTVAVKRMKQKYTTWDECVKLPEVQVLRKIGTHPNIIKLREVIRENNELFFVFEFMDGDLLGVIRQAKQSFATSASPLSLPIPLTKVKAIMFQLLQALQHIHRSGYFHRDLKPENLLVKRDASSVHEVVKLADFGLVKEVRSRPPFTDYVSTRWYRAPELLLQDRAYNTPVDMWAAGCIMAELLTTRPLFPGNNETDQLFRIVAVLGAPTEATWSDGMQLARRIRYTFPTVAPTPLAKLMPAGLPQAALDLMQKLLVYDPKARLSAQQALQHPFFKVGLDDDGESACLSLPIVRQPSKPNLGLAAGAAAAMPTLPSVAVVERRRSDATDELGDVGYKLPSLGGTSDASPFAPSLTKDRPPVDSQPTYVTAQPTAVFGSALEGTSGIGTSSKPSSSSDVARVTPPSGTRSKVPAPSATGNTGSFALPPVGRMEHRPSLSQVTPTSYRIPSASKVTTKFAYPMTVAAKKDSGPSLPNPPRRGSLLPVGTKGVDSDVSSILRNFVEDTGIGSKPPSSVPLSVQKDPLWSEESAVTKLLGHARYRGGGGGAVGGVEGRQYGRRAQLPPVT